MKIQKPRDLRSVGNVPQETLAYLQSKRAPPKPRIQAGGSVVLKVLFSTLAFLLVLGWAAGLNNKSASQATAPMDGRVSTVHPEPLVNAVSPLKNCNVSDAEAVLNSARVMARIDEAGSIINYNFRSEWWGTVEPKKTDLMTGISNAGACKNKIARLIIFHSPSGEEIGVADLISGLRFK